MNRIIINNANREEWLEQRLNYITATEVLNVLCLYNSIFLKDDNWTYKYNNINLHPFSLYQLYCLKNFTFQQREIYTDYLKKAKPAMMKSAEYGTEQEANVAIEGHKLLQEQEEFANSKLIPNGQALYCLEEYHIGATPDYFVEKENGEKVILECKTMYNQTKDQDKVVEKYKIQVQTQLLCTGLTTGYIIICRHDNKQFTDKEIIEIQADQEIQQNIIDAVLKIWNVISDKSIDPEEYRDITDPMDDLFAKIRYYSYDDYLKDYLKLKEQEKLIDNSAEDLLTTAIKNYIKNDAVSDNYSVKTRETKTSYYTIDEIDKAISELQKKKERILAGEPVVKREGSTSIIGVLTK